MNRPTGVPTISPRDAAAALSAGSGDTGDRGPLLVDVREADEFATQRAVGAVLIPISEFVARHEELPRDRPLLMICQSGSRSMSATMFLLQRGWTDVRNVEGGTGAWAAAGLPTGHGAPAPGEGDLPS
ncbi:MAG TPA: rhodanese-like domain-containing protein [Candidatus Limnocylindrales bacterium]|jgi:rhodanese-related sulfurtransferase